MPNEPLLRHTLDISDVNRININIEAYQRIIDFYTEYQEKHGVFEYAEERIDNLNAILAEYMIAREFAKEAGKTYRLDPS